MNIPRLAGAAVVGLAAWVLPSAAAATTHRCTPLTIRGVRYHDIVAIGVGCGYVQNVFLEATPGTPSHEAARAEQATGWTYVGAVILSRHSQRDSWTKGPETIVYVATIPGRSPTP